jgi:hypothetical protein
MRKTARISPSVVMAVFMLVAAFHTLQCRDERRPLGKITQELASAPDVRNGVGAVQNGRRCVLRDCVCNVCKSGAAQDFKVWVVVTRGRIPRARWCVCALLLHSDANMMHCVLSVKIKMHGGANFFSGPLLAALGFVGAKRLGHPAVGQLD